MKESKIIEIKNKNENKNSFLIENIIMTLSNKEALRKLKIEIDYNQSITTILKDSKGDPSKKKLSIVVSLEVKNENNSGYLQLFINDIKISRIYSKWFHTPERFFSKKENSIKIKLFTNLHDELTIDNKPIEFEIKVAK